MTQFPEGPAKKGSKKWIQKLINEEPDLLDRQLKQNLNLPKDEQIEWLSPLKKHCYVEYCDQAFLEKLELQTKILNLSEFWPKSGPRWDGLGKSSSGKVFLVEAKSHIPELISTSQAKDPNSIDKIRKSLEETKKKLGSKTDFDWSRTFYQYANRLAHVYFLRQNETCAYFVSIYFLNDLEMKGPKTVNEWKGALRLLHSCLGLKEQMLQGFVLELFIDVNSINNR